MKTLVINAQDTVLGRIASFAAKQAREGNKVIIINAEKAIITGSPKKTQQEFKQRRERGDVYKGPFYPKTAAGTLKRSIRGMLPYKKAMGRKAFELIKVYEGVPKEIKETPIILEKATAKKLKTPKKISLGEISKWLGSKK